MQRKPPGVQAFLDTNNEQPAAEEWLEILNSPTTPEFKKEVGPRLCSATRSSSVPIRMQVSVQRRCALSSGTVVPDSRAVLLVGSRLLSPALRGSSVGTGPILYIPQFVFSRHPPRPQLLFVLRHIKLSAAGGSAAINLTFPRAKNQAPLRGFLANRFSSISNNSRIGRIVQIQQEPISKPRPHQKATHHGRRNGVSRCYGEDRH